MKHRLTNLKLFIMKNFFFIIILITCKTNAQIPVTDVAASSAINMQGQQRAQENIDILTQLKEINRNLTKNNQVLEESKKVQEDIKEIKKREEDDLLKVPSHIKNGNTMNNILTRETRILKSIKMLINIANNPSFGRSEIESFVNPIMKLTSMNVDDAIKLCSDNVYRMQQSDRIKNLENINVTLSNLETKLKNKVNEYESFLTTENESIQNKQRFDEMKKKKIVINKQQL